MMARATGLWSSLYARRSAYAIYRVIGSKKNIRVSSFLKLRGVWEATHEENGIH